MFLEGDIFNCCQLDRIARSVTHSKFIEELLNRGVKVPILNMGIMDNTPTSKLIRTIFFALQNLKEVVERTQEEKIARQREGYQEGRHK